MIISPFFCQNQDLQRWSSTQGPIAGGNFEAAFFQLSSILKCLDGMFHYTVNIFGTCRLLVRQLWGMAEFCSSCCVVDTVRHHAKAWPRFCFLFWLSASFCLSQMFRNEYKYASEWCWHKINSSLWYKMEMTKHSIVYLTLLFPSTGNAVMSVTHLPRNSPLIWSRADQIWSSRTLKIVRRLYRCLLIGSERYDSWTGFTVASRDCSVPRCFCGMQENVQTLFHTWWMLCSGCVTVNFLPLNLNKIKEVVWGFCFWIILY